MSTANYGRFIALGKKMLTKYGALTTIQSVVSVANPDEPWTEGNTETKTYLNLLSAKFDPIKTLDRKGQPLQCDATFYVAIKGLEGVEELPQNTTIFQNSSASQKWSVVKSELIKPAETGVLWILWVNRYA